MIPKFLHHALPVLAALGSLSVPASAQGLGQPEPGAIGFQESASPLMDSIQVFHDNMLMWIITVITIFVLLLLVWVMVRYNRRANPNPSQVTHNTFVEIVWTVVPVAVLVVIAIPSFGVLSDQLTMPDGERSYLGTSIFNRGGGTVVPAPEMTIKATGVQWNWEYEYADLGGASFSSFMLNDEDLASMKPGEPRLLAVDYNLVVPVDTTVRLQVTANDVIHAFALPSFGVKIDAVPGRLNETWFHATKPGIYYGQCSELCGKDHAFMPIAVQVVSKEEFATWAAALEESSDPETANLTLASL